MPRLLDHPQEIDKTYTPLEAKRRSQMNLRNVRYGFYGVPKGPVEPTLCFKCSKPIDGQALIINGVPQHYNPCGQ